MNEEIAYKVIKIIESNPEISQRQLAGSLGISLGKTNYCIKALVEKGIIKVRNFKNSHKKLAYTYLLTPKGINEKAKITYRFLKKRLAEYKQLHEEIEELRAEVQRLKTIDGANIMQKTDV